jgi:hypothetical protein
LPEAVQAVTLELLEATGRLAVADRMEAEVHGRILFICDELLRQSPAAVALMPLPREPDYTNPAYLAALNATTTSIVAPPSTVATATADPRVASEASMSETPSSPGPPLARSAANTTARINPMRPTPSDDQVLPASATVPMTSNVPGAVPAVGRTAVDDLKRADAWQLFPLIDGRENDPVRAELVRRGFTSAEIEIGRRLSSDDSDERRRYAKLLPTISGIDLRPWLLHLADDEDEEVRRTAVAVMGTMNDPSFLVRLREMALDDDDEEVRQTAARATGRGDDLR